MRRLCWKSMERCEKLSDLCGSWFLAGLWLVNLHSRAWLSQRWIVLFEWTNPL